MVHSPRRHHGVDQDVCQEPGSREGKVGLLPVTQAPTHSCMLSSLVCSDTISLLSMLCRCFYCAGVQAKDINEVLLVGGMTRMPKVCDLLSPHLRTAKCCVVALCIQALPV